MRSLELNLASRPFRNNTLLWVGYALLAVTVVTFTAWNTVTFVDTRRQLDDLRNTVGSVESRISTVDQRERSVEDRIGKYDVKYLSTRTTRANQVILRKAFSWTNLFNVLEKIQPYEVKMSSVRPIFGSDSGGPTLVSSIGGPEAIPVSVDGVAKSVQAFFDFEDALIESEYIDRVEPSRSNRAKNGEILFTLSFLYYPNKLAQKQKPDPEQAAALHNATVLEDEADEAPEEADATAEGPATPPDAAKLQTPEGSDPAGRPLFKSTGRRSIPEKPSQAPPKKEANR